MSTTRIVRPGAGEQYAVSLEADQSLSIGFDTSAVSVERTENDLIFRFDDNSEILVDDFFATGDNPLPNFVFDDGMEISSAEVLSRLSATMDITPAAGPASSSVLSGGSRVYAEGAGDLVDGIDGLGGLGIGFEGADVEPFSFVTGPLLASAAAQDAPLAPGADDPLPPVPPVLPDEPESDKGYHARLVVTNGNAPDAPMEAYALRMAYNPGPDNSSAVYRFQALDAEGNLVTDPSRISFPNLDEDQLEYFTLGASYYDEYGEYVESVFDDKGNICVQLTEAGREALESGALAQDTLTIRVDGKDYQMPLIINDDQSYDAKVEEGRADLDTALKSEWYDVDGSVNVGVEYDEQGNAVIPDGKSISMGGTDYNFVHIGGAFSTNGEYWSPEGERDPLSIHNSIVTNGSKADTITIDGAIQVQNTVNGGTSISTGTGDDNISVYGMDIYETYNGGNSIITGDGNDTVHLGDEYGYGGSMSAGWLDGVSSNSIDTGAGKDVVSASEMYAYGEYGKNTIDTGADDDTVNVGSMYITGYAEYEGNNENSIHTGNGNDSVNVEQMYIYDSQDGKNIIDTGAGNDNVTVGSMTAYYAQNGENTINTGAGDDTIIVSDYAETYSDGKNQILAGDGNDTIDLSDATIYEDGLLVDAGSGNDVIFGGSGYNNIYGGAGNDTIHLSDDAEDVLVWKGGDQGEHGPAVDVIKGFSDNDVLDLSGLMETLLTDGNSLDDLVSFSVSDGSTTINIGSADNPGQTVQQIVLQDVALDTSNGTDYDALVAQQIILQTAS